MMPEPMSGKSIKLQSTDYRTGIIEIRCISCGRVKQYNDAANEGWMLMHLNSDQYSCNRCLEATKEKLYEKDCDSLVLETEI